MVKFPDGWILGLSDGLLKDFKCEVRSMQDGVYFIDQFENGYEEIFKCANTIISVNKEMEAKSALLKQKAKELSELFLNSSLDELENLEFNFNKKITVESIAKMLYLSPAYVRNIFYDRFGMAPKQYLQNLKYLLPCSILARQIIRQRLGGLHRHSSSQAFGD